MNIVRALRQRSVIFCLAVGPLLWVGSADGTCPRAWAQIARENPFDVEQAALALRAKREGRRPRGILPLLELWQNWDWASPERTQALLEQLAGDSRLSAERRSFVEGLLARAMLRSGDVDGSNQRIRELGYVRSWRVVGSFDNEGKQGFDRPYGPEENLLAEWQAEDVYEGRERPVRWREYPSETSRLGYINFDALFRPYENVCAYAETFVLSERAQDLTLWAGAGGAIRVWWNGREVLSDEHYRQPYFDRHVVSVRAHEGPNRVLVKNCVADSTWGFFLRVGNPRGGPATDVYADAERYRTVQEFVPGPPLTVDRTLDALELAAERGRPGDEEAFARFLAYTRADDPVEQRAKQLAIRVAERQPTIDRLELAASLSETRGEILRLGELAERRFARQRGGRFFLSLVRSGGPSPEDALPMLRGLRREGVHDTISLRAAALEAKILADLETPVAALRRLDEVIVGEVERAPGWRLLQAELAERAGQSDAALALRREVVAARYDHVPSRRFLALEAVRQGDLEKATEQLETLQHLLPDNTRNMSFVARMYEGLGDETEAVAVLQRAHALSPEEASLLVSLGELQIRAEEPEAAASSLRQALALRPQDANTRELLEQIEPHRVRADEAYAVSVEELQGRRAASSGFPTTVLQNLTVNTVFPNGLGSSFHQFAAQAHDPEGARQLRTYSVQFDPNTQRVDIRKARVIRENGAVLEATQTFERQLGEPWYRIYYDTRARVLVFPDLEPGDFIEIQYRVDDVSHRNLFADYFGDLQFLQRFVPQKHFEYVLITPRDREFYFNDPGIEGLVRNRVFNESERIDRFVWDDVPAIRGEEGMPGMTEISPYLHVSTYRTWEDVGRWWWGLVRDQLQIDDRLRDVVAELVAGAEDIATKVSRIQNWVVRNTRYVALEFGIHGYKPYRVPQIVRRGFGDCKDKASLLYVMFREAGIDARIALVRTRRNGHIGDLPASLAVFDHAIAYVPELDLYIDGTAEHNGSRELPAMDQGVTVLVVGPEDARLTQTPVLEPARNRRTRRVEAHLLPDGTASVQVSEAVTGSQSARYRRIYSARGTREDRFERSLRSLFPGLVLENYEMGNLEDLEADVDVTYRARVPNFANRDGSTLRMSPSVLKDLVRGFAPNSARRYALDLGAPSSYLEDRVLHVPEGFAAASVPNARSVESEFGHLRLTVDSSRGEVRMQTEFEMRRDRIEAEEYPRFRQWIEEADAVLRQPVSLRGDAQ